jgi:hypothetical protein
LIPTGRISLLICALLTATPGVHADSHQTLQRGEPRNPHGPLKEDCRACHTLTSWKPIRAHPEFDHNQTRYPLRGMHASVDCRSCHVKLVFTNVGTKCADCHADLHRGQFGARCEECHTVNGWNVSVQAINAHQNRFPLVGAHAAVDCASCHTGAAVGQFRALSIECVSCHLRDYQNAKTLDHKALGLPTTCESCHSVDSWLGASFNHAAVTGFPLVGAHSKLDCTACHLGGRFQGTPADCYGCHAKDYQGATNPNHVSAGFPQDCTLCHNLLSWAGATFDHSKTPFPLTGAHVSVPCASCHVGGRFAGTPTDRYSCHKTEYQGTTNPNHVAAGFPTTCGTCHTTTAWTGATFNHTWFPIPHHTAQLCSDCHTNPSNYAVFVCTNCHTQAQTDPQHQGVQGYVWNSANCYACHKNAGG